MAKKESGEDQLFYANKLNELISSREKLMRRTAAQGDRQANIARMILAAQQKAAQMSERQNASVESLAENMEQARDRADELASSLEDAAGAAEDAAEGMGGICGFFKKFAGPMAMAGAAIGGIASAFQKIANFGVGVVSTLFSVAKGIASIALAIVSIPFKLFFGLLEAIGRRTRIDPVIKSLETLREKVGDLGRAMGKAARVGARTLVSQQYKMISAGWSLATIFGYGREGAAKAVEHFGTIVEGMGTSMQHATQDIKTQALELTIFSKAMGMAADDIGLVNSQSKALGLDGPGDIMADQAKWVVKAGRTFQMSFKNLNKDVNKLRKQFVYFGADSKVMVKTAVYARKLGIEVESLGKVVDHWLDFDKAAESAAGLAQIFGANVDVMKMVTSNSPADSMDELRRAVLATGRSYETMTIAEKKALAQMAGVDDKTAMMAFSAKNAGLSYGEISSSMEDSKEPMQDAASAMKTLVREIKRIFMETPKLKGFFDAFKQGFMKGVQYSGPFQNAFWTIHNALRQTYFMGMQVGTMFVNMFPGVSKIFNGLAQIFNAKDWTGFLDEVRKSFAAFFGMLEHDPKMALTTWLENIKTSFLNYFGGATGGGGMVLDGLGQFVGAVGRIFEAAMQLAVDKITEGIQRMLVYIDNPDLIPGGIGDAFDSFTTRFSEMGDKAVKYLEESFTGERASGLADALGALISNSIDSAFGPGTMAVLKGNAKQMIKDTAQTLSDAKNLLLIYQNLIWDGQAWQLGWA